MTEPWSRRRFLLTLGAALGAVLTSCSGETTEETVAPLITVAPEPPTTSTTVPMTTSTSTTTTTAPPPTFDRVPAGGLDPLIAMGQAALLSGGVETDVDSLLESLDLGSSDDILAALGASSDMAKADFARGQVIALDGWRFSLTEARIGALAYLTG